MIKAEYPEAAAARYDELQELNKLAGFYDYETEFIKIWHGLRPTFFTNPVSVILDLQFHNYHSIRGLPSPEL